MKRNRRVFLLAMLVCLILGISKGIRECMGAACALSVVNVVLSLEELKMNGKE